MVHPLLSLQNTTNMKGVAILLVILSHIGHDGFHHRMFVPLGGFGVAIFLILSGYGLMESFKKKGLENYFRKRFLRILTPYILWVMIYTIIMYGMQWQIFLSDIRYWFVEYISIWYIVFFFVQKYVRRYRWLLFGLTAIVSFYFLPCLQAQQSLSFIIGVAISEYKSKLEQLDKKKLYKTAVLFIVIGIFAFAAKQGLAMYYSNISSPDFLIVSNVDDDNNLRKFVQILTKVPIALALIIIMQIKAEKINIKYIGTVAYELYLVHMPFYSMIDCNYLYLILFFLFVFAMAVILSWCNKKITQTIIGLINV